MDIQQATKIALENDLFITRTNEYWLRHFKNKPDGNFLFSCYTRTSEDGKQLWQEVGRGWQPQVEDILADDWVVCN
ncbi:MAG: hypothetical protein RUMPE_01344 [Eubacteriales bacterium SKADARSKE-1]|nr:hypothetical protein [Eubacteriales bacterium SKADARSKE-1]MDQ5984297.1 hypothetical protein [Eubacteriales bacterium SKADARSKE-1]